MSIWSDIHKRSNGKQIRKEDFNDLSTELENPIVFAGTLNGSNIPPHSTGRIYVITCDCTIDGVEYKYGDTLLDMGNGWQLISAQDIVSSCFQEENPEHISGVCTI